MRNFLGLNRYRNRLWCFGWGMAPDVYMKTFKILSALVAFLALGHQCVVAAGSPGVTILVHPISKSVTAGATATFGVVALAPGGITYEWSHGGTKIAGATNWTLTLTNVQLADAGDYVAIVRASGKQVDSNPATLTVAGLAIQDVEGPTLKVKEPTPGVYARSLVEQITFSGTASDDTGVAGICYQRGNDPWVDLGGAINWSFSASLVPGTNRFQIKSGDIVGNYSVTQQVVVFYSVTQSLSLTVVGAGQVAGAVDGQGLEIGRYYTLRATPSAGTYFTNWTIDGVSSTNPALTFYMWSNTTVTANFVGNPFIPRAGSFNGLFYDTNEPVHETSGFFTFKLTDQGKYSGKLTMDGESSSFSGQFGMDLRAQQTVVRKSPNPSIVITLQLAVDPDQVTGTVSTGLQTSTMEGYRATFSSSINPATNFVGKYTIAFSGSADAAISPFGLGYGVVTVSTAGGVVFSGALGDGVTAAQKVPLAANGQWPLYVPLYKSQGSVFGWLTFGDTGTSDVSGLLLWTKPAGVAGICHPSGFISDVSVKGSRYTVPLSGVRSLTFSNASVRLEGGNLTAATTSDVYLNEFNKVTLLSVETNKLALKLTSSSGLIGGSFIHPQTLKKSTIKGVVLQRQDVGSGFFLGTNQSGSFIFGLPENFSLFETVP